MRRGVLSMVLGGLIAGGATFGGGCGNTGVEFGTGTGAGGNGGAGSKATGGSGGTSVTSTSSSSSGATTSTGSTSTSTSTTTSSGGGCTVDPQDNACVQCTKQSCCNELVPCQNNQACVCWTGCLSQNPNNPGACAGCGPYDAVTSAFVNCGVQKCSTPCGGGSTTSSSSSSTSSSSTNSGGGLCAPVAGDSQCTACAKSKCCNQVTACAGSQSCLCWVTCLAQGGSTTSCFGACGIPDATTNSLTACSLQQCPGICP